ncbi:hypothetical protein U1Q18_044218, partial [Sarracenia purpurea var. burkii]
MNKYKIRGSSNSFQALSSCHEGYEECFPSLDGVEKRISKQRYEPSTPFSQNLKIFTKEEDKRCQEWAFTALSKATEDRSPLNNEELDIVVDWLAYHRGFDEDEIMNWFYSQSSEKAKGVSATSVRGKSKLPFAYGKHDAFFLGKIAHDLAEQGDSPPLSEPVEALGGASKEAPMASGQLIVDQGEAKAKINKSRNVVEADSEGSEAGVFQSSKAATPMASVKEGSEADVDMSSPVSQKFEDDNESDVDDGSDSGGSDEDSGVSENNNEGEVGNHGTPLVQVSSAERKTIAPCVFSSTEAKDVGENVEEDMVVDEASGDAVPAEICTEDVGKNKQDSTEAKQRCAPSLPLSWASNVGGNILVAHPKPAESDSSCMGEVNIPNSGTDFVQISGDNSSKPAFELPSEEKGVNGSDLVHKAHSEGANVGASQMLDKMPQRNRDIAEVKQDQSIPKKTWAHIVGSKSLSLDSRVSRSDLKEDKSHVSVGFQPSDQTFRSARPASQQSSRAPAQADAQLCRPAPADLAEQPCHPIRPRHPVRYCDKQSNLGSAVPSCGTAPHLSPASLASLHIKAIEGS